MHDRGFGPNGERRSVLGRGPLWRRSASRSAMSGWRDFALRGPFRVKRPIGAGSPGQNLRSRFSASRAKLKGEGQDADDQPADRNAAHGAEVAQKGAGAAAVAAEARRVHARLYDDPEEAELGAAESRQGAPDQRLRGDRLHPG